MKKLSVTLVVLIGIFSQNVFAEGPAQSRLYIEWMGSSNNECLDAFIAAGIKVRSQLIDPYFKKEQDETALRLMKAAAFLNNLPSGKEKQIVSYYKDNPVKDHGKYGKHQEAVDSLLEKNGLREVVIQCPIGSNPSVTSEPNKPDEYKCKDSKSSREVTPISISNLYFNVQQFSSTGAARASLDSCTSIRSRTATSPKGDLITFGEIWFCQGLDLKSGTLYNHAYAGRTENGSWASLPDEAKINGKLLSEYVYDEMPRKCFDKFPRASSTSGGGTGNYRPTTPDSETPNSGGAEI
ncbi:hypothetical protein K2X30_06120 [bacterium]|nr:hypothetical protein [bacterium]